MQSVLTTLGMRENNTARLEEAVAAYREALKEQTRENAPPLWASTQSSLAGALTTLGMRENNTARLEEAVAAYREALKEQTRENAPPLWASTQSGLAGVLTTLGESENNTARLEEAVAAYREALKDRPVSARRRNGPRSSSALGLHSPRSARAKTTPRAWRRRSPPIAKR